jgi:thiamine monophosphate synthase
VPREEEEEEEEEEEGPQYIPTGSLYMAPTKYNKLKAEGFF